MQNFVKYSPTKVVFGKNTIKEISSLITPETKQVLVLHGQGNSAVRSGVLDKVLKALQTDPARQVIVFGKIEQNPDFATLKECLSLYGHMAAPIDLIVAIGGGSVIDAAKCISCMLADPDAEYDTITEPGYCPHRNHHNTPVGVVLTCPASSSEVNNSMVISEKTRKLKRSVTHESLFPVWAIVDPETTSTLSKEQLCSGIVDAFSHVLEQYTANLSSTNRTTLLQDRMAEAIMVTLKELAQEVLTKVNLDYALRANLTWAASQALEGSIGLGVADQCWSSHAIAQELTAVFGIQHAHTVALILPKVLEFEKESRKAKLAQLAVRVFGSNLSSEEALADAAISQINLLFESLGMKSKINEIQEVGVPITDQDMVALVEDRFSCTLLAPEANIGHDEVLQLLRKCL